MYELLTESKQAIQSYTIDGTIGDVVFDEDFVLKGSLSLSKLCTGSSEFRLGGCHIGQLNISFVGVNVPRNSWEGKEIEITIGIGEKEIPIGVYTVDTATHSKGIVAVTAFDNMKKFDKACGTDAGTYGSPYNLLSLACDACGVDLGMTQAEVEALPNGLSQLILSDMGDIETWRDFIYWIAVSLCSFATVDRNGDLVLKTFHTSVDDTIDSDMRIQGSTYSDEVITYTGLIVYAADDKANEYYHATIDNGYSLNIGNNPFMQASKAMRLSMANNIVNALANIHFNSCKVRVPFGFHYDLGDVLKFPNGQGSSTNLFCVMGVSLNYNGECILSGIPGQKISQSKTDKNLQGLLSTVGKNEFTSYELRNANPITINDDEEKRLILARIASNTATKAQIHMEVNLESLADEGEDVTQGIVTYLVNSEDTEFYPTETWIDGNHVLHLMYILPIEANQFHTFDVYMKSVGGTITIDRGGVWFYASGSGLVGDARWNGIIEIQEDVEGFLIPQLIVVGATDTVTITTEQATRITSDGSVRATSDGSSRTIKE